MASMRSCYRSLSLRVAAAGAAVALLSGASLAQTGPDVIVGDLPAVDHWTTGGAVNGLRAYSVGTTSCNIGDQPLAWQDSTSLHPVITQNMYRLSGGRIEQIGQSWLKHGFCALQEELCQPCTPVGFSCESALGVGCSDPYNSTLNGLQDGLGPRSDVNPSTGVFPYPFTTFGQTGDAIYKRVQVRQTDLTTPGALYFVEGQYIHPDDAAAGNGDNNASYRRVTVNGDFSISVRDTTQRTRPAILAWRDNGLGIGAADPDVYVADVDVPSDGRFVVAFKVTNNGDGTWHYEYAIENLNSDRAGASLSVPLLDGKTASGLYFHDVDYHSGEPYDNTDWSGAAGAAAVTWSSPQTFAQNPNSNALRWGTMYNFAFDSDGAPVEATVTLGLFKPGSPAEVTFTGLAPGNAPLSLMADAGNPSAVAPGAATPVRVTIDQGDDALVAGSPMLHYRLNASDPFSQSPLTALGSGVYEGSLPGASCGDEPQYYFSAAGQSTGTVTQPPQGSAAPTAIEIGTLAESTDDMETDTGWTSGAPGDTAATGMWVRADPVGTAAQPEDDHSPAGTICWVTGNALPGDADGTNDVDGGTTTLISPAYDLSGASRATIGYWRWYSNNAGAAPNSDVFTVDVSDDGQAWVNVETVGPFGEQNGGGWFYHEFAVESLVSLSATVRVRFIAEDADPGSLVEAAIDDVGVTTLMCAGPQACEAELTGDDPPNVDVFDLLTYLAAWFGHDPAAELTGDDPASIDVFDLLAYLSLWFEGC